MRAIAFALSFSLVRRAGCAHIHAMATNYRLVDSFNYNVLSHHRTLEAAVRAQRKHSKRVEQANGRGSYLTYIYEQSVDGGAWTAVDGEALVESKMVVDRA